MAEKPKAPSKKSVDDALAKLNETQCAVTEEAFEILEAPKPEPVKTASKPGKFAITFEDTRLIREFEGHHLTAYPDPATNGDPWTISYGITGSWVKKGVVITQEESDKRFMEYIQVFCADLDSLLKVECTKNQYIAMLSLLWNIGKGNMGKSTLIKKVNAKDFKGAAEEFLRWDKAAGKVMRGLTRRREAERAVFLKGANNVASV
jgi:lysozyme